MAENPSGPGSGSGSGQDPDGPPTGWPPPMFQIVEAASGMGTFYTTLLNMGIGDETAYAMTMAWYQMMLSMTVHLANGATLGTGAAETGPDADTGTDGTAAES